MKKNISPLSFVMPMQIGIPYFAIVKRMLTFVSTTMLLSVQSLAQPAIQWQRCHGGTDLDASISAHQTLDGGYILGGFTYSNDGEVTNHHAQMDYWIIKLDGTGNLQWQKCLGGSNAETVLSIKQTNDAGYIAVGYTNSLDGDIVGNHGFFDCWVVKLDSAGNVLWSKCLGGTWDDNSYDIYQTPDGGYIVAGITQSNDGDVSGLHGFSDVWIVKIDSVGNVLWQNCYGGSSYDEAYCIQPTADGGFVVAGSTQSNDGDVTGNQGDFDYWIIKIDSVGTLQWQKCYGGTQEDKSNSITQTSDGGYIVAGFADSNNGHVTGNHGGKDLWVLKLDANGNLQWQKCYGGTINDEAKSVIQLLSGGYVISGYIRSGNGDVTCLQGSSDFWVIQLDSNGNLLWQRCLGGTGNDRANSVEQTSDGGFMVAGFSNSTDGDVTGYFGSNDFWIVKLSAFVSIIDIGANNIATLFPNPFTTTATIKFSSPLRSATFRLYNLFGQKIMETSGINGESFRINAEGLSSGVYVYEVTEKEKKICGGKAVVY